MNRIALAIAALLIASPALAHPGHGAGFPGGGFTAGFAHPLGGFDHVLAMVAVGLWAALRGQAARWAWPAAFIGSMAGGFALTQGGLVVPQIEMMIAASVILLGGAVAFGLGAPLIVGAAAIATFGLFHGAAHGMEVHGAPQTFAAGFILASALLHAVGLGLAHLSAGVAARWPQILAGGGIAAAGVAFAIAAI